MHRVRLVRESLAALIESRRRPPDLGVRLAASMSDLPQHEGADIAIAIVDADHLRPEDPAFAAMLAELRGTLGEACPVLVVSERDETPEDGLAAIRRGASGLFPASLGAGMLIPAIGLVLSGGLFVSPATLRDAARQRPPSPASMRPAGEIKPCQG